MKTTNGDRPTREARGLRRGIAASATLAVLVAAGVLARTSPPTAQAAPETPPAWIGVDAERATESRRCGACHPAIYAEHRQNTHGAAFHDEEARLATREFRRENCVRCHTPRPVAETGLGRVPIERRHDLEEGNTCMSCHAKAGYDYAKFEGGRECKVAFDDRVGTVEACATCHRVAGTPEQWEHARLGRLANTRCVDCHMPVVTRPVALGEPPRPVRAHVFPASRSEDQLRRAYTYDVRIDGDEAVVTLANVGAGHNFPTATIQRAVESLVIVRDPTGREVGRDRAFYGFPYLEPTGRRLPRPTQIPSGEAREQRVRLEAGKGTVECSLFFKLYHPIADDHPTLSRGPEWSTLPLAGATPLEPAPAASGTPGGHPAARLADAARPDGLAKYAHLAPEVEEVPVPTGKAADDLARLVALLEFPVPGARAAARARLVELGAGAVPALVEGLGHWSDETRDQSMALLARIGGPAVPALERALGDARLYVRYHARLALGGMRLDAPTRSRVRAALVAALSAPHPLDRRSALDAIDGPGDAPTSAAVRALLGDPDADVVSATAKACVRLEDRAAIPALEAALTRAPFVETRRDLAAALAALGSATGVPLLLDGLDHPDDVLRRTFAAALFDATGLHESYDPDAPRPERLEAIARIASAWERDGAARLRPLVRTDPRAHERAWRDVETLGGGTDTHPGGDDEALLPDLVSQGAAAVPALLEGLTFPSGFVRKRALVCEALARIGDPRAAPALVGALRDPDLLVAGWACRALSTCGDAQCVPALRRWSRRLASLASGPQDRPVGPVDALLARAAWTRDRLGDPAAAAEAAALAADPAVAASPPPAVAPATIATTEAPPVPVPTSLADAVAKAQALRAADFYEDAVRVLADAEARYGPSAPLRLEHAWNLLMIAEEDVTRDAPRERIDAQVVVARAAFEAALRLDPKVPGQDLLQLKLLRYEGSTRLAHALARSLVARDPDDYDVRREYADLAYLEGEWSTAEREYLAAWRLRPQDAWARLYATMSRQWLERPPTELEAGYLEAARLLPAEPMPFERLASLYADAPDRTEALLERALAASPSSVPARVLLARTLASRRAFDLAERHLADAIALAPASPLPRRELAHVARAAGRPADALAHALAALDVSSPTEAPPIADELDAWLRDPGFASIPTATRAHAWEALVAKLPHTGAYAHDAGVWYRDVAADLDAATHFLEEAVRAEPSRDDYRAELQGMRGAPGAGR